LNDLHLAETPRLLVLNKIDRLSAEDRARVVDAPGAIAISACDAASTQPLLDAIETALWRQGRLPPQAPPAQALTVAPEAVLADEDGQLLAADDRV
jgi:50S ribosomal subunit-associated GTPase HflX